MQEPLVAIGNYIANIPVSCISSLTVMMRGLNRQYGAALTNFVGSFLFLFYLVSLFASSSVPLV